MKAVTTGWCDAAAERGRFESSPAGSAAQQQYDSREPADLAPVGNADRIRPGQVWPARTYLDPEIQQFRVHVVQAGAHTFLVHAM